MGQADTPNQSIGSPWDFALATQRLWNHANLGEAGPDDQSLLFALWNAESKAVPPPLAPLINDVLSCLTIANLAINGPIPSESRTEQRKIQLVTDIAYAISGIIAQGMIYMRRWQREQKFDASVQDCLSRGLSQIAYAWDALLAGDIDDLLEGFDVAEQ